MDGITKPAMRLPSTLMLATATSSPAPEFTGDAEPPRNLGNR
jgi:hypothetical protein